MPTTTFPGPLPAVAPNRVQPQKLSCRPAVDLGYLGTPMQSEAAMTALLGVQPVAYPGTGYPNDPVARGSAIAPRRLRRDR